MSDASPTDILILHVDDDPDFAETARLFLERETDRLSVDTATTVPEARSTLDDRDVDCVVSDYDMPSCDGIEFLQTIRAEDPDLPFILFTGAGSEEVASTAISAGVTDYLQKETGTDQYTILANRIINAVERARAEQAKERHLEAIETAQEGISILDEDGRFIYVNEAYADLYGYDREDLLGERWQRLYPDEDVETVENEIFPQLQDLGYWHGTTAGLHADGRTFRKEHTLTVTEAGELICSVQDAGANQSQRRAIADLHSTARALIQAETVEEVAESAADAVGDILDMPGNGVHLYDEAEDGLVPVAWTDRTEELVGEPPVFTPGEGLAWQAYETGELLRYDDVSTEPDRYNPETVIRSQIILPLGEHGVLVIGSPEPDAFSETAVSLAQTVAAHTTAAIDRVEREEALAQQNDRLETFTSIVSHDLRNPLAVAIGRLEIAQEECDCPSLDNVEQALDRTVTLLDDLQAFAMAGAGTVETEPIDLTSLCETCWHHVETGAATLVTDTDRTIRADSSRLQELIENLVRNAVEHGSTRPDLQGYQDATDGWSSDVSVTAASVDTDEQRPPEGGTPTHQDAVTHDGDGVTITIGDCEGGFYVADDGPGIPADEREQIFERGYSTSDTGTGFGLSIVREICDIHGWEISVTDSDAGGARFEITGVAIETDG